ncbi:GapA-binding peptide SR1P [Scopulibacillus cellulosilyticus]|uniref:GapA-binding peptide SR1P n=1 Tax=Scopulibacillus cellulosilyticus TaxID=2665665 RepID=A0ABW2Q0M8_9BACL
MNKIPLMEVSLYYSFSCVFIIVTIKKIWGKMMGEELKVKQETIICQVCGEVIDIVNGPEGVKTLYGMCSDCFKNKALRKRPILRIL